MAGSTAGGEKDGMVKEVKKKKRKAVVVLPGLLNCTEDYLPMVRRISASNGAESYMCSIANVRRVDWLRNARGVLDTEYWTGNFKPRPTVDWYLERIEAAVAEAEAATGKSGAAGSVDDDAAAAELCLLCHSAGGWLGRVWMEADGNYERVSTYVSLGSPQLPPPDGVLDQTRGILRHIDETIPGCFHDSVRYVTVSGRWRRGAGSFDGRNAQAFFAGLTYKQVCGEADVWGDGITPEASAHLPDAQRIVLDDCYHSPVGSEEDESDREWYGNEAKLSQWIEHV